MFPCTAAGNVINFEARHFLSSEPADGSVSVGKGQLQLHLQLSLACRGLAILNPHPKSNHLCKQL